MVFISKCTVYNVCELFFTSFVYFLPVGGFLGSYLIKDWCIEVSRFVNANRLQLY